MSAAAASTPGKEPVAFDPHYEYNAPKFRDFSMPSPPDAEYEQYFNSTQPAQLTPPGAASSSGVTPSIAALDMPLGGAAVAATAKQINFDDAAEAPSAARPAAAAAAAAAALTAAASAGALADALISAMPPIPPTPNKAVSEAQAALPPFKHSESTASAPAAAAASSSSASASASSTGAVKTKSERKSMDGRATNTAALKKRRTSVAPAAASSGARTRSSSVSARKAPLPSVARGKSPAKPALAAAAAAPAPAPASTRGRSRTKSDAGAELAKQLSGNKRKSTGGALATPRASSRTPSARPAAAAAAAAITAGSASARSASARRSLGATAAAAAASESSSARGRSRTRASVGGASNPTTPRAGSASARSRSASRDAKQSLGASASSGALSARATPSRAGLRSSGRTSLGASASAGKLTVAASPNLRTKSRTRPGAAEPKSTEDAELEAIEKGRAELQKRRKLNEATVAAVLSEVGSVLPVRSTKSLTEPQEFHFSTDDRLGKKQIKPKTPKRTPLKASASVPAITVPAPFTFESDKRIKGNAEDVKPFVPLAAAVDSFLKAPRDAAVPLPAAAAAALQASASQPTLTQPKEFQFHTSARARDAKVLSTEEREAQEMAAIKPFRAAPLSDKVMQSNGEVGVPKVKKAAATIPREFHFATAEKAAEHAAKEAERAAGAATKPVAYLLQQHPEIVAEEEAMLRARQLAAEKAAEERVFSCLAPKPVTVPMSPNITKPNPKKRKTPSPPGAKFQFKARDMPDATPFKPDYAQAKPATAAVPFSLATDERGAQKEQKFIATLEREAEEARRAREFKAQEIGAGVAHPAPAAGVAPKPLTEPAPFALESVRRAEAHRLQLQKQMEDEMAKENAQFNSFKARDLPADLTAPFVPKKSGAPLTELAPFQLASDSRAEQRSDFELSKAERQAKAAAAQAARAAEIAAAEAAAVKQLRASMVHHALPVMSVDQPFAPAPAKVAPTVPMSPPLQTKARAHGGLRASMSTASLQR